MTVPEGRWVPVSVPGQTQRFDWIPAEQPPSPDGMPGIWHVIGQPGGPGRWQWFPVPRLVLPHPAPATASEQEGEKAAAASSANADNPAQFHAAEQLQAREWKRHGMHRLYVNTADGKCVGYLDLEAGEVHLDVPYLKHSFESVVVDWHRHANRPLPPSLGVVAYGRDLARNRPGAAARQQARQLRSRAPIRTLLSRLVDSPTEERAWRTGADGERIVAGILAQLDRRWRAIHAVPVGNRGTDIDHVLIGPGGVYTLNAKHHPRGNVWVGGEHVRVNGHPVRYVRNARFEGERAARLLSAAARRPVSVLPFVVIVGARELTVSEQPEGVVLVEARRLLRHFRGQPELLSADAIDQIHAAARNSVTWNC